MTLAFWGCSSASENEGAANDDSPSVADSQETPSGSSTNEQTAGSDESSSSSNAESDSTTSHNESNSTSETDTSNTDGSTNTPSSGATSSLSEQNKDLRYEDIPAEYIVTVEELADQVRHGHPYILDLRTAYVYDKAFINNSHNIPAGRQLEVRYDELPTDEVIYLVDEDDSRVAEARQTLIDLGFAPENLLVLEGGIDAWIEAGNPTKSQESKGC